MTEALFVMLNNYFHDLAVAFLFASSLMAHLVVLRSGRGRRRRRSREILQQRVAWGADLGHSWRRRSVVVLQGVRVAAESRNGCRCPHSAVKHVLLVGLTDWGLWGLW